MNRNKTKLIALFSIMGALLLGAGVTLAPKDVIKTEAAEYTQLTNVSTITSAKRYVLGIDGSGFHYSGTSNWGLTSTTEAPLEYELAVVNASEKTFTAKTTISGTTYYLTIPTSNTFTMSTSSTTLRLGANVHTTEIGAIKNSTTDARHLRRNGTSGLRSYAGTTGAVAFFYEIPGQTQNFGTLTSISIKYPATKTTFIIGETFSSQGLAITASDDSSPPVTKDLSSGFSTNYDGVTFNASHLGTKTVIISYTESVTKTTTYNITVLAALPSFKLVSGTTLSVGATHTIATTAGTNQFAISAYNDGGYFGNTAITKSSNKFDDNDNILKFVVENGSAVGSYAFKILNTSAAGKYITYTGSGNNLYATAKETIDALASWTIGGDGLITNADATNRTIKYNSSSPRFACYTSGQVNASIFVDESTIIPEPEFENTTRIELATDFAKKIYFVHETFTSVGLKVIAYDDVNEVSKIVDTGFITDFDDKVFVSADVDEDVSVTVTYDGFDETYLIDINEPRQFVKVTSKFQLQIGGSYIATGIDTDDGLVALGKQEGTNRNVASIIQIGGDLYENDAVQILRLHKGHDDVANSFAFESVGGPKNGQFLAATGTGTANNMSSQESITAKGSWVINVGATTTIEATGAGYSRNKMRYNDTNNIFSAYEGGQGDITLYVDESSILEPTYYEAKLFADFVMGLTDAGHVTTPDCEDNFMEAWIEWDELSSGAKASFKTHEDFAEARQRFTHWAKVNGFDSLDDLDSGAKVTLNVSSSNSIYIIVIVSILGISTLAGYYFIRKRPKEEIN